MYYVLFVGAGKETTIEQIIKKVAPSDLYRDCFHPVRHLKKKIRGEWTHLYRALIPGYIFIESDNIDAMYECIAKAPRFKKALKYVNEDGSFDFYSLRPSEENWLMNICGRQPFEKIHPVIELTQVGFDECNKVVIISGPLKGHEGMVRKIHLHKRMADIDVEFMGRKVILCLGVEIISNANENQQ